MKNIKRLTLALSVAGIVFLVASFSQYGKIPLHNYGKSVHVSRVIDGDTIELSDGEEVRYIGIDTPERYERQGSGWIYNPRPYAEIAKDFNAKLVMAKPVRLEFDVKKRDRYNRLLAYVYSEEKMVNEELVREGYAMIYTYPPNVKYMEKFVDAQRYARENKKGFWSGLENNIISTSMAGRNLGLFRAVEAKVVDTYISEGVLILNCSDNFKVVIFKDNLAYFPKTASRSPDTYFKHKTIRVFGVIKDYKSSYEIVLYAPSQLEILE